MDDFLARQVLRLSALADRLLRGCLPLTLLSFLIVGALGVVVHMTILHACMYLATDSFRAANGIAMIGAASFNYFLNNKATFASSSLSGRRWIVGYAIYLLITSFGLVLSMVVSGAVFDQIGQPAFAALCGIICGSAWNYVMSQNFVWKLLNRFRTVNP